QPSTIDARRAKIVSDGGGGAVGGSAPTAERSLMRQSGLPITSSLARPSAAWSMKQWITPMTGKPGLAALLAIGVWQQSAYHRKTLLERLRQRRASVPTVSFTRRGGIWKMSVPPLASSTSGRPRKRANAWQSSQ